MRVAPGRTLVYAKPVRTPIAMPSSLTSLRLLLCCATLALIAIGCGGGGGSVVVPPGAPVIAAVTPSGPVGIETDEVTFAATASNSPTSWQWNFGGASAGAATSTEATPSITLGLKSTWVCSVIATNDAGSSAPYNFTVEIAQAPSPVITSVTPTGEVGANGDWITFSAEAVQEDVVWSWDFGGGAIPNHSSEQTPRVSLRADDRDEAETHSGQVSAMRPGTSAPAAVREFELAVRRAPIAAVSTDFGVFRSFGSGIFEGRPFVVGQSAGSRIPLSLFLATVSHPSTLDQWTAHAILPGIGGAGDARVTSNNDSVMVVFTGQHEFSVAVANFQSPGEWLVYPLPSFGPTTEQYYLHLRAAYIAGKPVVYHEESSQHYPPTMMMAASELPVSADEWTPLDVSGVEVGPLLASTEQGGFLFRSGVRGEASDQLNLALAPESGTFAAVSDMNLSVVATQAEDYRSAGMAIGYGGGGIAVVYDTAQGLVLASTVDRSPAGPLDWRRSLVVAHDRSVPGSGTQFAVTECDQLLHTERGWTLIYSQSERTSLGSSGTVRVATATDLPEGPGDWHTLVLDGTGFSGSTPSSSYGTSVDLITLSALQGSPAIQLSTAHQGGHFFWSETTWLIPVAP